MEGMGMHQMIMTMTHKASEKRKEGQGGRGWQEQWLTTLKMASFVYSLGRSANKLLKE